MQKDYIQSISKKNQPVLGASLFGLASINLKEVTSIIQIGENITETNAIYFVVIGKDGSNASKVVVLKVDSNFDITVVDNSTAS